MPATTRLVRTGKPDIYATIARRGLRWDWTIWTAGPTGPELTWGRTWTRRRAWVEAIAAAHRPDLPLGVKR